MSSNNDTTNGANNNASANEPSKISGQYHSMKGTAVEMIGNAAGSQPWQQSGQQEHNSGEAEYKAAEAKAYVEGAADRVGGKVDSVMGAVAGDKQQQFSGTARHESGKKQMELNGPN